MGTQRIEYSDTIPALLNVSRELFEQEAKMTLAVKLFEMGGLSSGHAASLAGVSRVVFLLTGQHFGTPSTAWDQTEFEYEFTYIP